MKSLLRIATRKSPLALWQAEYVKSALEQAHPGLNVELVLMTTQGDKILDTPLAKIGGKGLFVKELEVAMLEGKADIAVHSMKDVPMAFPEGLGLVTICERENPSDALVSNQYSQLDDLPTGAIVGTSSLRRRCQLMHLRPDLDIRDCRGNVNTRLSKLDAGEYDALILASAGLIRLGMHNRIRSELLITASLPACGQGAVGIEARIEDTDTQALLAPLNHLETQIRVTAERAMNHRLEGGCQVPIAGFSQLTQGQLSLEGRVGAIDGSELLRIQQSLPLTPSDALQQAEVLGHRVADALLESGAKRLLQMAYN